MTTPESVNERKAKKEAKKEAKRKAKRKAERKAERQLAVDEAYQTLDEYHINRRRIVFIANDERRAGGFGVVRQAQLHASSYLPTWISSQFYDQPQVVAVKEINLSAMYDPSDIKRAFTKEVLVWSRLKGHPGIAKFLGFCADLGRKEAWLISPWEPYGNVSEFISGRELEVPERLSLAYDTIDALTFLHQLDPPVCHGDLKSANVLVNSELRAVLCDFGLARLYDDSGFGRLESTAVIKGSIRWCSPELLDGKPRAASSDIYAWAWLVWEIMTGELPYGEATADYVIMRKIFEGPINQVDGESRLRDALQLWDLQTRCWAADPLLRPTGAMCKTTFEYLPHCPPTPKTAGPHTRSAALLENLGNLENWKGNYEAGDDYLEQALHLFEEEGNDKGMASVLHKQAAAAYFASNRAKIMKPASAVLEKCRSLRDDIGVAHALFWIGYGEPMLEDAIRKVQESLEIFRAKGNSVGLVKCLERLGELYRDQGQPAKAVSSLEEAVDIASRCGDRVGEANSLITLGTTHWKLNHLDQAISTFQRAHDIAKRVGWEHGLSTCLCRLGSIKLQQGIHAEAEELLRESVRVARNSNAGWRLAQAHRRFGMCFQAQGRLEEAIQALEESCSAYQNLAPDHGSELAHAAALLGGLKFTLGHKEEALAWYDKAIAEYREYEDEYEDDISDCLAAKDAILADMNRHKEGALHGEASS